MIVYLLFTSFLLLTIGSLFYKHQFLSDPNWTRRRMLRHVCLECASTLPARL